jgi:flagellar protein FlaJ
LPLSRFEDIFEGISYRIFRYITPRFPITSRLKSSLLKAGVKIYPEAYVSMMLFSAISALPVTVLSLYYMSKSIFILPLALTPLLVMVGFILAPSLKASSRAQNLEREMPFVSAYITIMSSGGVSPYTSIKRIASTDLMPAMRREARELMRDVEIFGLDPLSAIDKAAKASPSDDFREFFSGYVSTAISGGDIVHFLEMKTEEIFRSRAQKVKVSAERLGMLLESFITVMILMSICFYILFSVESIYSIGLSTYSTLILYTYVFAPLLSIIFIYLAHDIQPKTPITDWRPYKAYAVCLSIATLVLMLLTGFLGLIQIPILNALKNAVDITIAVAVALATSTAAPAAVYSKISRRKTGVEQGMASFLRDLTEVRKTGLSIEECIKNLSNRNYGLFSYELKKISAQISWGVPLRRVLTDFIKRTKSWQSQLIIFLLMEAIDVGGGTVKMMETLTRFSTLIHEIEREKKASVRPYVMMPYFAATLLMVTNLMILTFLAKTVLMAGMAVNLDEISKMFIISIMFHVYMIGLVTGKITEESISAGFKHSTLLVIIGLASTFIPNVIKI